MEHGIGIMQSGAMELSVGADDHTTCRRLQTFTRGSGMGSGGVTELTLCECVCWIRLIMIDDM